VVGSFWGKSFFFVGRKKEATTNLDRRGVSRGGDPYVREKRARTLGEKGRRSDHRGRGGGPPCDYLRLRRRELLFHRKEKKLESESPGRGGVQQFCTRKERKLPPQKKVCIKGGGEGFKPGEKRKGDSAKSVRQGKKVFW